MITSDTNFRGNFDSIEAVWEAIPYGGVEGDYLNIQGVKYRWNKYLAMWENAEVVTETPSRETVTFDEDVNMQNNLTVAGVLRAKKFVVDDLPTGIEEVEVTESAVSGGNNVVTITYTNGESQTFNIKNGEAGKTMGAFGFASSTASQSTWNTAKNYLVPTANEGEFNVYSYEADAWSLVDTFEVSIAGTADAVEYDDTTTQLSADNVQEAIEALNNKTYPIDDELDETSTLPVQNKVVSKEINNANSYLKGDVKTLAVGQTYALDEAVKTADGKMLRMTKEIKSLNLVDAITTGDLKSYSGATYRALKAVDTYNSATTYEEGDYAVGRPAGAEIEVTVDSEVIAVLTEAVDITVTIVGVECTVSVDAESTAVSIAADILTAFGTQSEWSLTDNEDGTLTLISKVAKSAAPTISSSVGESGVTVAFVADSTYAGATTTSKYVDGAWSAASVANMADDTTLFESKDAAWLEANVTIDNTASKDILYSTAWVSNEKFDLSRQSAYIYNSKNITVATITSGYKWTTSTNTTSGNTGYFSIPELSIGSKFKISFNYYSNLNTNTTIRMGMLPLITSSNRSYPTQGEVLGVIAANTSGVFEKELVYDNETFRYISLAFNTGNSQNKKLEITNIHIYEYASVKESVESLNSAATGWEKVDAFTIMNGRVSSSNEWVTSSGNSSKYIKVNSGEVYKVYSNPSYSGVYTWLTSVETNSVHFVPKYVSYLTIPSNSSKVLVVPEGAKFLCFTENVSNTNRGVIAIYRQRDAEESFAEIENVKSAIYGAEPLNLTSYTTRDRVITINGVWGSSTAANHKLIPVGDYSAFQITANSTATYCIFAWLVDTSSSAGGTPSFALGEERRYNISKGTTAIVNVPEGAVYLYLENVDSTTYLPSEVKGLTYLNTAVASNSARISALEGNTSFIKSYKGGKIDLRTYHYDISSWINSDKQHQSGACWGDYYFMLTNLMSTIYVWNLKKKTIVVTWSNPTPKTSAIYHCNQCTFGVTYYDQNDPFPLLYVTVNNDGDERCAQEVYRIVATYDSTTQEYTSFDFVLVQLIKLPALTSSNCLGNANMAIDRQRKVMVFYSRDNNYSGYKACRITEIGIPSFTPVEGDTLQTVVLEDINIRQGYYTNSHGIYQQGACIHAGKLFIARGYESVNVIELIVVDLLQKCQIACIDLLADGFTLEPEGVFIYNDELCISTNWSKFYIIRFE